MIFVIFSLSKDNILGKYKMSSHIYNIYPHLMVKLTVKKIMPALIISIELGAACFQTHYLVFLQHRSFSCQQIKSTAAASANKYFCI